MHASIFPQEAFLPPRGAGEKLARLFNAHAYTPRDIRSVRGSVYYSDFETVDGRLRYVVSIGHALRRPEGDFNLYVSQVQITEDTIRSGISINAGYDAEHDSLPVLPTCREDELLARMEEMEGHLRARAQYGLAFPRTLPLRLCDDVHIGAVRAMFARPCKKDAVIYHQERLSYRDGLCCG